MTPIYFYIPQSDWPSTLPQRADEYWQWQCAMSSTYNWSLYNWTLQTYLRLKESGFPCELVGTMPSEGIIVAHRYSLPDELQPGPKMLIVCLQADKGRHTYAHLHVVQNPLDDVYRKASSLWDGDYIPLWPQPGLIPRDRARGDRFENVAYLGRERELAPELQDPAWQEQLNELGLRWHILGNRDQWNDYSQVDVMLAVRGFGSPGGFSWKPPSKLVNAWHAGIPAILGYELAFRSERKSEFDYIEVMSPTEALLALKRLRDDKALRDSMVENGRIRAQETQVSRMVERWSNFLLKKAVPAYERWSNGSNFYRQSFLQLRRLAIETRDIRHQMRNVRGQITAPVKSLISRFKGS